MNFLEFKASAMRADNKINNRIHFFSHYFSVYFAYLLYRLTFTPYQASFLFFLTGIASSYFLSIEYILVSYLLWRLHIILDMADGDIARATERFSELGHRIDMLAHSIINPMIIFFLIELVSNNTTLAIISSFLSVIINNLKYFDKRKYEFDVQFRGNLYVILLRECVSIEGFYIVAFLSFYFENIGNYAATYIFLAILLQLLYRAKKYFSN